MSRQGDYVVEPKLDGDRLLLHFRRESAGTSGGGNGASVNGANGGSVTGSSSGVRGARVEWWSRNRKNYTSTYQDSMGPVLERAIPKSVTDCLVDGEMTAVDLATGRFLPFGEKRPTHGNAGNGNGNNGKKGMGRSAGSGGNGGTQGAGENTEGEHEACGSRDVFVAFDLLWLNGRCLAGEPLHERRRLLRETFHFEDHHFELIPQQVVGKDADKGTQRVRGGGRVWTRGGLWCSGDGVVRVLVSGCRSPASSHLSSPCRLFLASRDASECPSIPLLLPRGSRDARARLPTRAYAAPPLSLYHTTPSLRSSISWPTSFPAVHELDSTSTTHAPPSLNFLYCSSFCLNSVVWPRQLPVNICRLNRSCVS